MKSVIKLIVSRIAVGLVTLWLVTVMVFVSTEILPGDVAQAVLGQSATPETLASLRQQLGLDQPAVYRYATWLSGFATGNLGTSLANGSEISSLLSERFRNTFVLAAVTAAVVVPLSIMLGLLAAMFPESLLDRAVSVSSLFLVAIPEFLLGTLLVLFFAVYLKWFPAVSYSTDFRSIGHFASTIFLPVLTLSAALAAQMARMTRALVTNILGSAYIEMALLKGTRRKMIILRHAAVNAIGPIANVVALNLAYLISGVVIVETIFAYPGLAKLMVDGVSSRDFPVVQSCALIFCAVYIFFMLVADIVSIISNPRLKKRRAKDNERGN